MKKFLTVIAAVAAAACLSVPVFAKSAGRVVVPLPNADNVVNFETGNETIAQLYFKGGSSDEKFYVNVSNSWNDCAFASEFADKEAYITTFTFNGTIPARTTPTIYIYSPYDDDVTEKGYVYEIKDDKMFDVTDSFRLGTNTSGQKLYACRTMTPGCYILSLDPVDESLLDGDAKENGLTTRVDVIKTEQKAETEQPTGLRLPSKA